MAIDEVLVPSANYNLTCHCDFLVLLITHRALRGIRVVEHQSDTCFGDTSLTLLVHQLLQVTDADLRQVGNTEHKANGI